MKGALRNAGVLGPDAAMQSIRDDMARTRERLDELLTQRAAIKVEPAMEE